MSQSSVPNKQANSLRLSIDTPQGTPNLSAPTTPVIPPGVPNGFNEGLFTAKEQFHDQQIADLLTRMSSMESHSNFVDGAMWAIGILFVVAVALLKLFWKGIVKVILAEAESNLAVKPATHP
jgi:hypothetical protein